MVLHNKIRVSAVARQQIDHSGLPTVQGCFSSYQRKSQVEMTQAGWLQSTKTWAIWFQREIRGQQRNIRNRAAWEIYSVGTPQSTWFESQIRAAPARTIIYFSVVLFFFFYQKLCMNFPRLVAASLRNHHQYLCLPFGGAIASRWRNPERMIETKTLVSAWRMMGVSK